MIGIPSSLISLTALSSFQRQLSVTSNNLANVNTAGFSRGRTDLSTLSTGLGVDVARVASEIGGSGVEPTDIATHLSLMGGGFFAVRSPEGEVAYTRAGQFHVDAQGYLVDPHGNRVQGASVDPTTGASRGVPGDIRVPDAGAGVRPTTELKFSLNLDSNAEPPSAPFDPANAAGTSNFATAATVVDRQGGEQTVEFYFRKVGVESAFDNGGQSVQLNRWDWFAVTSEGGTPSVQASGTLRFKGDGALFDAVTSDSTFSFGGSSEQQVAISFGTPTQSSGTGLDGATQFAGESVVTGLEHDGSPYGAITGVSVDASGALVAQSSSGTTTAFARVAVATFADPSSLSPIGGNLFAASAASGAPLLSDPGVGAAGSIVSGGLETSNVDLSTELVQMLREQGAYRANLRMVGASDDLVREVLDLTR